MSIKDIEDAKDIALKLDLIRKNSPEDYFFIKGWIHHSISQKDRQATTPYSVHEKLERYQQEIKLQDSERGVQHELIQEER